jgi:hypothetical protein
VCLFTVVTTDRLCLSTMKIPASAAAVPFNEKRRKPALL